MESYKQRFAQILAESGAIFFDQGLVLKDGRPSPYFVNMGRFRTGRLASELGEFFAARLLDAGLADRVDVILGPSYKGSAIAVAAATALWKNHGLDVLYEYDRKEAKTHGEATASKNMFVNGCFSESRRIVVVDDVATSMATKVELVEKVREEGARNSVNLDLLAVIIGVDRQQTTAVRDDHGNVILGVKGVNAAEDFTRQTGIPVHSVCGIREVVEYLFNERIPVSVGKVKRPLEAQEKDAFDEYLHIYGS
jgi:orotate phosphoribosyltransferase